MLGKLLKYELKSASRSFIPIYIGMIVVASIIGIFGFVDSPEIIGIGSVVLVALMVALTVITVMVIIQRFNNNLLKDEGYLMFTLPVKVEQLVMSKLLASIIYMIISTFVVIFSFMIIMFFSGVLVEILGSLKELNLSLSMYLVDGKDIALNFIYMFVDTILGYIVLILTIYLSISLGQLKIFNDKKTIAGIMGFAVIKTITAWLVGKILELSGMESIVGITATSVSINIVLSILFFILVVYILKNKLNLE